MKEGKKSYRASLEDRAKGFHPTTSEARPKNIRYISQGVTESSTLPGFLKSINEGRDSY